LIDSLHGNDAVTKIRTFSYFARPGIRGALIAAVAAALGACETGSSVLGGASTSTPLVSNAAPTPAPQPPLTKVTIAPVIGAPDAVGRGLSQDLAGQIAKHKASVVAAGERSDYTLRGYIVAAKDKANTKVSYIWDVTDPAGKRLNRITGEEIVSGQAPKDPWSAVSPQVIATIAQKSANSFGAWLPTQASAAGTPIAAAPAGAGASPGVAAVQTASVGGAAAATQRPQSAVAPASAPATGPVSAIVPSVTGAPGDGATSLAKALQSELSKNGVALGGQPASAYRVEGVVQLTAAQGGRQNIQIDWNVKDPQGKKVGTVSQKNEIPEGSLDGAWGTTAGAAAAAAAQGILKLLPR
jgi:hypothetical protein